MVQAVDTLQAEGKTVRGRRARRPLRSLRRLLPICCPSSRARGVPLVEDAAEALGASHAGRAAGSFGRSAALSFNGNKIMTTSGGGMLLSDDLDLLDRARYLSTQARQPVPWYEHTDVGYNYRMSNVLAALGRGQLERLDDMIARRREIRDRYAEGARRPTGTYGCWGVPGPTPTTSDNCWLTTIVIDRDGTERRRRRGVRAQREPTSRRATSGSPCTCSRSTRRTAPSSTASPTTSSAPVSPCRAGRASADDDIDRVIVALTGHLDVMSATLPRRQAGPRPRDRRACLRRLPARAGSRRACSSAASSDARCSSSSAAGPARRAVHDAQVPHHAPGRRGAGAWSTTPRG